MRKPRITKKCIYKEDSRERSSSFEKSFEAYVEKKVKTIMEHPEKYPFIQLVHGEAYDSDKL
ncbi:TPA: hypothetical protein TUI13_001638 [Streptococcus equi subsp. zooepidemicus]|nr:hypothetical protein [Streptococcus equi subsp. zooepidemicus]HEL0175309.1 hypothetical protein [Streptococcus equi subsp. zooepidemicus]HEL0189423.1 hypothetical protein [Streptococcus equi subsp. zooepidemicus]HEL0215374.1 hypothetical protein [Streptococcus equi subsp. zooepidemicus]HEL0253201.1 hypothetical protein [Streptococcus equi subsp. zooepidemicus]